MSHAGVIEMTKYTFHKIELKTYLDVRKKNYRKRVKYLNPTLELENLFSEAKI